MKLDPELVTSPFSNINMSSLRMITQICSVVLVKLGIQKAGQRVEFKKQTFIIFILAY